MRHDHNGQTNQIKCNDVHALQNADKIITHTKKTHKLVLSKYAKITFNYAKNMLPPNSKVYGSEKSRFFWQPKHIKQTQCI